MVCYLACHAIALLVPYMVRCDHEVFSVTWVTRFKSLSRATLCAVDDINKGRKYRSVCAISNISLMFRLHLTVSALDNEK